MKVGQELKVLRDERHPLGSPNTRIVAAALACGFEFAHNKAFTYSVDGEGKPNVTWQMSAEPVTLRLVDGTEERVDFSTFKERFEDHAWCGENPDHPISYLAAFSFKMNRLRDQIRSMEPLARVKRNTGTALIPHDTDDKQLREILKGN